MGGFADLHVPGQPMVLPNGWDVGSARALVAAGFSAVGTTSLGVAASHGLPDASRASRETTEATVNQLVRARLGCFLTVDLEDGFSDDPGEVADLVAALGEGGSGVEGLALHGINLEDATADALVPAQELASKVRAVKERCPEVFVNARTDVFWLRRWDVDDAVARLRAYVDAGADGVFVPGALDAVTIERIVTAVDAPVNVLASSALTYQDLAGVGVARISTGSLLYRVAMTQIVDVARCVRDSLPLQRSTTYEEVQALHTPAPK